MPEEFFVFSFRYGRETKTGFKQTTMSVLKIRSCVATRKRLVTTIILSRMRGEGTLGCNNNGISGLLNLHIGWICKLGSEVDGE